MRSLIAAGLGVATGHQNDVFLETQPAHGVLVALAAFLGTRPRTTVYVADAGMPQGVAVIDGDLRSGTVIVGNAVGRGCLRRRAMEDNHRHRATDVADRLLIDAGAGQNQTIHPQLEQILYGFCLPLLLSFAGCEQDLVAQFSGLVLDARDDIAKKGIAQVGDHHPDDPRPALNQTSCHGVWSVIELGSGFENCLAALVGDPRVTANHQRDQGLGDAGATGDITDRGSALWGVPSMA